MDNREFLLFQQNLRKTALGVRFGKQLLTDPDSLSAETITKVLLAMGLKLPPDVKIAADAAQALITGHAAIQAFQDAESLTDYQSAITMSANSVQLLARVAEEMKWIDSKTASMIEIGYDVCMIVGSFGTNVGAWVRLALAIGAEEASAQAEAEFYAQKSAMDAYSKDYKVQIDNFVTTLNDLQAGKLGIFGFLAANAGKNQLVFNNVITNNPAFKPLVDRFPNLRMLPVGEWIYTGVGSGSTWWGEGKSADYKLKVPALAIMEPTAACDFLLQWLIYPSLLTYSNARNEFMRAGKADLFNVAMLALFEKDFVLKRNMPVLDMLIKYRLSPYEFGEYGVFSSIVQQNAAIVSNIGGVLKQEQVFTKAQLDYLDQSGDISVLRNNRLANQQMQQRFDFGELVDEQGKMGISYGFKGSYFDWRNMSNFISMLDFMDMVYTDPDFKNFSKTSTTLQQYDILPRINDFKKRFQDLYMTSMVRRVNNASLANVSYFLNAPIAKLDLNPRPNSSTVFKTK